MRSASPLRIVEPDKIPVSALEAVDPQALETVKTLLKNIKEGGIQSMLEVAVSLGDIPSKDTPYLLGKKLLHSRSHMKEMESAFESLPAAHQEVLRRCHARVQAFAKSQMDSLVHMEMDIPGGKAGHSISPVAVAGCYAPGGRYPLPSSHCAEVWSIVSWLADHLPHLETKYQQVVASPHPQPVTLAAAYISGADVFLAVGGAQSIASMAYGLGDVPKCDVIVGPGNKYVTAAKWLVSAECGIDMLAGPSEILIIADATSSATLIAADLLAQAEHDTDARPILVTTDRAVIEKVNDSITEQLSDLPTRDTAEKACEKGFAVICENIQEAVAISDKIAPEHLEIQTTHSEDVAEQCSNYGSMFVGGKSAMVLGDYGTGPNHVLPTGSSARYTGGLSVLNFLRVRTWMRIDNSIANQPVLQDAVTLARLEGLEAHARSAEYRIVSDEPRSKKQYIIPDAN